MALLNRERNQQSASLASDSSCRLLHSAFNHHSHPTANIETAGQGRLGRGGQGAGAGVRGPGLHQGGRGGPDRVRDTDHAWFVRIRVCSPRPRPPKTRVRPIHTPPLPPPPPQKITKNTHSARSAADKNTARTFYAAGVFYDVMQQFKAVPGEGRCVCCLSFCRGPLAALVASCVSFVHMADRCFFGGPSNKVHDILTAHRLNPPSIHPLYLHAARRSRRRSGSWSAGASTASGRRPRSSTPSRRVRAAAKMRRSRGWGWAHTKVWRASCVFD